MARAMKPSGVEWLGEIPADWTLIKGKYLFRQRNEKGNSIELQLLSPTQKYGVIPQQMYDELSGMSAVKLSENVDYSTLKSIYEGDFCISLRSFQGGFEYSRYNGVVSPAYQVFYKIADLCNDYYRYMFKERGFISKMTSYTKTFRDGKSISFTDFANSLIPVPPIDEQERIAAFLDGECARIDSVVEKTRASIEEYRKLKQSIITRAVTKGIRPNRPTKDSGVDWLGQVPADWKISRVGRHFDIVLGKMLCSNPPTGDYTLEPYYCAANVHFDGVSNDDLKQMWFSPIEKEQYLVSLGDLLVVEGGAGAGGCAIVTETQRPTYIQNSVMIVRSKTNSSRYLKYLLECLVKSGYIDVVCNKATIPHFTKEKLANVPMLISNEQQEIADYLDEKTAAIDSLVAKKKQLVSELESLKKSLIFEYVTGKKEVPK